jgi:uncharacterized membrane protein YjjP (DUF1212 family)
MNIYRIVSLICFVPLIVVTGVALIDVGLIGIFRLLLDSTAGWQVFIDLASALILTLMFLQADARRRNIRFWPWILATLMTGSIAPLLYLIIYGYESERA